MGQIRIRRVQNNHQQHISILFNYNKFQVIECIRFKVKEEELKLWNVIYQNKKQKVLSSREEKKKIYFYFWLIEIEIDISTSKNIYNHINFNKTALEFRCCDVWGWWTRKFLKLKCFEMELNFLHYYEIHECSVYVGWSEMGSF